MLWGILIAWVPHLDYLLAILFPTWLELYLLGVLGQSLVVAGIVSFYGGRGLARLWKKQKITAQEAGGFIFIVWLIVIAHAALTVDGARPLPFLEVCFPAMPQIDLLFTLPLVVALIKLSRHRTKKELSLRKKWLVRGILTSTSIMALGVVFKAWTHSSFTADLARRAVPVERMMEAPSSWNRLLWRSVVKSGDQLWVGYRSVFDLPSTPVRWTVYPIRPDSLTPLAREKEVKAALWQADGWWIARPNKQGVWIADLRQPEALAWGARKTMVDSRAHRAWLLDTTRKGNRLRQIEGHADPLDQFQRTCGRIIGDRESWGGNPRLAGVPGSLPESLMFYE